MANGPPHGPFATRNACHERAGQARRVAKRQTGGVKIELRGLRLPGRTFCDADGRPLENVHVAVQRKQEAEHPVPGDARDAWWDLDVIVRTAADGSLDFGGPYVHGRGGDRFVYLTWGDVGADGTFAMFRRAKLMLDRIDPELVRTADADGRALIGTVELSDAKGHPRCARVDPPAVRWSIDA